MRWNKTRQTDNLTVHTLVVDAAPSVWFEVTINEWKAETATVTIDKCFGRLLNDPDRETVAFVLFTSVPGAKRWAKKFVARKIQE